MKISWIFPLILLFAVSCNHDKYAQVEDYTGPGRITKLKDARMVQVSSYDTTGANNDRINIHPGQTATIMDVNGPGIITRIWVTIDSRDPYFLRRILLKMYWDDEKTPSVEVPVGDFFGNGFEYKHYTAQYLGMSSGGYYCYFPMPFNKKARIEVANETGQEVYAFYYQIDYFQLEKPLVPSTGYFHAHWNRDIRTDYPHNYKVLEAKGKGHFVGCNLQIEPYQKSFWYLEGDEMVYVDGESFPSIYGTGTEDYFTSGWYYKNGEFAAPYHGLILKDDITKRTVAYRHHIPDPIPFKDSIRFTIEHGHANKEIIDETSVAYWYQEEPHMDQGPIKKASLRIPLRAVIPNGCLEAEDMVFNSRSALADKQDMSGFGPEWSNLAQLTVNGNPGETFELQVSDLYEPEYNADMYVTCGPDYGIIRIASYGKSFQTFNGYREEIFPGGKVTLNNLHVRDGNLAIWFSIIGKDESSTGYLSGIDAVKLTPVRNYIPEWNLIGPFPNERESDILRYGLDQVYPPEEEIDLKEKYQGAESQVVAWQQIKTPENGYVSLWDRFSPYEFVVAYAQAWVYSPEEQTAPLLLGSDDGSKVFLNGEERYRFLDVRIAAPDQDTVQLNLQPGWNNLLLKIENNFGGYAFYARIIDRNSNLKYSLEAK